MSKISKLEVFADELIRQKRLVRSIEYALFISFIFLSMGIILALPLRFFSRIDFTLPLSLYLASLILSFIYGFLGIEKSLDVLVETDGKMSLSEKLSAAYQYGETNNPYSSLLVREAETIIENLNVQKVFHVRFSRRDPFQPLLLALFIFLWLSSFSFLQINDQTLAYGDMLFDASLKIDAVNSESGDTDLEDIAEEYRKLGQKIQDQFMREQSIEKEVEKLSRRLENKIDELSRKGVNKDSQTLEEDLNSEPYQLRRKKEMSDELNDIFQSLMKAFSISPDMMPGGSSEGERDNSGNGDGQSAFNEDYNDGEQGNTGETTEIEKTSTLDSGDSETQQESLSEGDSNSLKPGSSEGLKDEKEAGTKQSPISPEDSNEDVAGNNTPGAEAGSNEKINNSKREENESGEFDDENIRGELREGNQMKSFIRALPHRGEPTLEETKVLQYYRNQLENPIERELFPESYQTVVRDYFLSIGVLNE